MRTVDRANFKRRKDMNKTRKRSFTALLFVLASLFVLVLSLGVFCACGSESAETGSDESASGTWYYGDKEPAENLGKAGDYYLNTETLASYVKEGKTWRAATDGEAGNWYYGTEAPLETAGDVNDFYLNTETGELYHKSESGWGSPVLVLKGDKGRDGVVWFSGNKAPAKDDPALTDAVAGDFYLDYSEFDVYQRGANGEWTNLGSLRGESGKVVGWTVGKGKPTADTAVGEGGFYLDSDSGDIYQKTAEDEWALKGSLGNLSASHIKSVTYNSRYYGKSHWKGKILNPLDQLGGNANTVAGDTSIYGYWFEFDNGMALFVSAGDCRHTSGYSADDRYYLYNNDCEKGTVYWQKCKFCGELSLVTKEATEDAAHPMNTDDWKHNDTKHWHESVCSHKVIADEADHEYFTYATFEVGEGDEVQTDKYTVWYECSVCGYKYAQPSLDVLKDTAGVYHIRTAQEWNSFATKFNAGKVSTVSMAGVRVIAFPEDLTVSLDADIDFHGAALKPLGAEENPFKGTFKGNHSSIENFTFSGAHAGLFGVTENATVQDLTIVGAEVAAAGEGSCAGVLVAEAKGTLSVKDVKVLGSAATSAEGTADATVGGLVGKLTDGSVTVESVNVDCVGAENHAQGAEGNALVGGGGSVTFTGENEVGYTIAEGFVEKHYKTGSETTSVVYEISSVKGLEGFRDSVNGEGEFAGTGANNYAGKTVKLMNDLDFEGFDQDGKVIEKNIWWGSIGKGTFNNLGAGNTSWNEKTFNGTFDGQNHTIKNICLGYDNHANTPSSPNVHYGLYPSLFGGLVNATVKDLNFEKAEAGTAPASGPGGFGLLAMWQSGGTISDVDIDRLTLNGGGHNGALVAVAMSGKIEKCSLKNSTITGSQYTGGLVGRGAGNFDSCEIVGCTIESSWDFVGGVIGHWGHYGTSPNEVKMTNITVTGTKLVLTTRSMSRIDSAGMVVGYLHRIGDDKNGSQGKSIFDTVHVSDCSIEAKAEGSLSTLDLVSVGGVAGGIGAYRPGGQGASSTTGAMRVSFKGVAIDGFTVNSEGTVSYAGGIFGGRSASMFEAARQYGDVTLSFEDCSVKGFKINAGTKFTDKNTVTQSGYFVGSLESAAMMPGYPSPENGTFTFVFTGTNTYQPTAESLPAVGMEAEMYQTEGDAPTAKEEPGE